MRPMWYYHCMLTRHFSITQDNDTSWPPSSPSQRKGMPNPTLIAQIGHVPPPSPTTSCGHDTSISTSPNESNPSFLAPVIHLHPSIHLLLARDPLGRSVGASSMDYLTVRLMSILFIHLAMPRNGRPLKVSSDMLELSRVSGGKRLCIESSRRLVHVHGSMVTVKIKPQ